MAKQEVDIGTEGNDGTGDSIRESFRKVNENFQELYAVFGVDGNLSFLQLDDTPSAFESNKLLTSNATGDAIIFSSITSSDSTVGIDVVTTPGVINLTVTGIELINDRGTPTLGGHLNAAPYGIGGVSITNAAASELSTREGVSYTIDDLVITKGYADRRYITGGLPLRVATEPATVTQYTLSITSYSDGNIVIGGGHGYDSGINGTAFTFNAEDTDPTGLTTGTTYYIRYYSTTQLGMFANKADAATESQSAADTAKITVSGSIAALDTHTIVDTGYDSTLPGNFLSDVAVPRESIVRRQGDTMTGALTLHDHPGELAGLGTPNGQGDLQAASKYYVDNTAYSSPEVLFVSTAGNDLMTGVPAGKEGTANTYAYRTINAAAKRASELIGTAPEEPGPYFQTLAFGATTTTPGTASTTIASGVEAAVNVDTKSIITNNRAYLIKEVTGYLAFTYPEFAYNVGTCERDLGLVLDAVALDATRGDTANYLSRTAAERYYSSVSGRIAITSQLSRTDDSFAQLAALVAVGLTNGLLTPKTVTAITKKAGDIPALVTTSTTHGLVNGNQVIFKTVTGMTEISDKILYAKVITTGTFELFTDAALLVPYNNSTFTTFVNDGAAKIGLRYQSKLSPDTSVAALTDADNGYIAAAQNFALIRNIISNGISSGADLVFGRRYKLTITNSTAGQIDQTNPSNVDALPGKVIRGKRTGAVARIITYTQDTNSTIFYMQPLESKEFEVGEELEMGNFVKAKQIVIRVESGIYEEDYPIKLTKNVSLKGDEFRRCIIRPKRRVSQSTFASTYFYRDAEFDGMTLLTTGTPFINQTGVTQGYFGRHYLTDNTKPESVGATITNVGGYTAAANILELNRTFIQKEVGEYVDTTYPSIFSSNSRAKCERDVGLIVDAMVKDFKNGGKENVLEAQGEYYSGALAAGTEDETEDAIDYITILTTDLLAGTAPSTIRSTIAVDLTGGAAETEWAAGTSYAQNDFVIKTIGEDTFYYKSVVAHIAVTADANQIAGEDYLKLTNTAKWQLVSSSISLAGNLKDVVTFAFDAAYNPPKRNDADGMDVFLMDDATIIRNVTVQGHGGFMCVLDPVGQILTKSPYIQTASSFSRSRNAQAFSGGMYVDAFAGNIPMRVQGNSGNYTDGSGTIALNAFTIYVESQDVGGQDQGLKLRLPELPAPFYFEGQRYQVNAISNYDSGQGRAVLYLDPGSNSGNGWNNVGTDLIGAGGHGIEDFNQDIFLQTAGNRSILGNDFTQINDLGYGLVTTNGAFSEMVSMFTYYCHAAYYANNGSEIRSLNGSNGYGNFGLVAEGADPNEIPDEVTTARMGVQPIKAFTYSGFTNALDDTSITVYDFKEAPLANSYVYIDHGGALGPLNYRISRVENLADPSNAGLVGIGTGAAIVVTGVEAVDNTGITGTVPTGSASYNNVAQKSTTGTGSGVEFSIAKAGGVATFTITNTGSGYATTDDIVISGANIGGINGTNDLTIPVDTIFQGTPGTYITAGTTGNITAATAADPVVITSATHGLSNGERVLIDNVLGMVELNDNMYYVGNITTDTFTLYTNSGQTTAVKGSAFTAYTSGGTFTAEGGIGNNVYRMTLQAAGSNNDYFGAVQATITHDTLIEYRLGENFIFNGVANASGITARPSTAINFDEADTITYRSTGFTAKDDQSQDLGSDEVKAVFDDTFNYVELAVDFASRATVDPQNGAKTLGGTIADTKIAVTKIDNAITENRILQDATDASAQTILLPGDGGYGGGMVFAYQGKTLQVIDYQPVSFGLVTGATKTSPIVITSASHNKANGNSVEFREIGGMTQLNGQTLYVGNQTTNTYELFTDEAQSVPLDGTGYSTYTSGGKWVDSDSIWYIQTQDYQTDAADWDITGSTANNGIKTAFTAIRSLWLGARTGTTAEITISISLLRATGHDFTQIGTGGFNTSNYPNVLLGSPTQEKAGAYSGEDNATKAQVWERRKGRCFFITSDEDGFFRVGKYFVVDQSTGSITFSGEVGISRAASLGFKDGVTISEFSNDELFTDLSDTAVPTEKAVANYISRRLGHNGSIQLTGSSRIAPGFLALNGSTKMEAAINMNSKKITNLLDPTSDNDAATKDFVDQAVAAYDELDDLRNVTIHTRTGADLQKQMLVPTGYKRLTVAPTTGVIAAGDVLQDGSSTATVIAVETKFDQVINSNVQIITYSLLTGTGFSTTLTPVYVTSVGTKAATVLENPVDEFTNALESSTSDINIGVTRTASDTQVNLQIEAQAIIDADVNDDAKVAQAKLMLNRATTKANSSTLYGTDGDSTTGRQGQASRGLASFEDESFAEDIQLTTDDFISAAAGDVIIQGASRGYVTASVADSLTVVVRTTDTFTVAATAVQKAVVTNGVEQSPVAFVDGGAGSVAITQVLRSGYISLKDRSIPYGKFQNLTGGNTGDAFGGSVIGRATDGNGIAEEVSFSTVVAQGNGIQDSDIAGLLPYWANSPTNTVVTDPGAIIVATGTPGAGTYAFTNIEYDNSINSIVKRNITGAVHVNSLVLGGSPTYTVLSESGGTLSFKTPAQGTILTATGATKPTINTGGVIRVGDIGAYSESVHHADSDFGGVSATKETSALAARWIYSSFIEAPDEKDGTGTGIGIGAGTGFGSGGADVVTFVAGGAVRARVNTGGIDTDAISSLTANTDLTLTAAGTGKVYVNDTFQWTGTATGSINGNAATVTNGVYTTGVQSIAGLKTFTGGVTIEATDTLTVRTITTGAAATTGTITGTWSLGASSRFEATYADLAEYYEGDVEYTVGTVLVFGGDKEVTGSTEHRSTRVAGVVSDQSAYTMNQGCPGIKTLVALQGKVPVNVIGPVAKGDMLVASAIPGYAVVDNDPKVGSVIGKAIGTKESTERGTVDAVVGRV